MTGDVTLVSPQNLPLLVTELHKTLSAVHFERKTDRYEECNIIALYSARNIYDHENIYAYYSRCVEKYSLNAYFNCLFTIKNQFALG